MRIFRGWSVQGLLHNDLLKNAFGFSIVVVVSLVKLPTDEQFSQWNHYIHAHYRFAILGWCLFPKRLLKIFVYIQTKIIIYIIKTFNCIVIDFKEDKLKYFVLISTCVSLISNLVCVSPRWVYMIKNKTKHQLWWTEWQVFTLMLFTLYT